MSWRIDRLRLSFASTQGSSAPQLWSCRRVTPVIGVLQAIVGTVTRVKSGSSSKRGKSGVSVRLCEAQREH
ncbi:uncharacterized protein M421DRAFT_134664 [Didymella exigua CBS 183.55]|uniref:Uncharacterized protein n=1 Tax=Didymella exigua CBS 183.55 TaxID=1150837 RepID=A0A6A5RQ97_9PLEO|nr:uncharacterized protein M421DRAFT_134664 [Didymella exigua CBS 183.55]KAF1929224.1 hypothetical protein M421DRAFT_134664 [Didymella exigua CBS 183.55]